MSDSVGIISQRSALAAFFFKNFFTTWPVTKSNMCVT